MSRKNNVGLVKDLGHGSDNRVPKEKEPRRDDVRWQPEQKSDAGVISI